MNSNPLFSVIIPHKNRQQMLQRCLNSIPRRDDVQIIVVDDNSDPKQVDFKQFPGINDNHIEVYFTKKGRGAGFARNIGLEHAKGKWVLFADSDDWYYDNLSKMMDKYADSGFDMLIFRTKRVDCNGNFVPDYISDKFDKAISTQVYDWIKYSYPCPIGRFIKRDFIEKNKLRFQEVMYSNDVMFSLKASVCAQSILVVDEYIYCVFESLKSLTRNNNWQSPYIRTKVSLDAYSYLKNKGKEYHVEKVWINFWNRLWKMNKIMAVWLLFTKVKSVYGINGMFLKSCLLFKMNYPKYYSLFFQTNK